ncbi:MAG: hypothetical protein K2J99_10565 [Lachnospiraceae bacterium]|nr:hypothetical protein [Lachnospiraceae bacterium]
MGQGERANKEAAFLWRCCFFLFLDRKRKEDMLKSSELDHIFAECVA